MGQGATAGTRESASIDAVERLVQRAVAWQRFDPIGTGRHVAQYLSMIHQILRKNDISYVFHFIHCW
jgi:hypothetical protein